METKDLNSTNHQNQNSDNVVNKNELKSNENNTSDNNQEKKESAADLILKKFAERSKKNDNNLHSIAKELDSKKQEEKESEKDKQEENIDKNTESKKEEKQTENKPPKSNYSQLSLNELVNEIKLVLEYPIENITTEIETIKSYFYKKLKTEVEEEKTTFIEKGGLETDFVAPQKDTEIQFKELYKQYKDKKTEQNNKLEKEKEENLKSKYIIINEIENLINSQETLNKTFDDFKNLQKQWHEIGLVPQNEVKKMWESYNYQVERFYDYVKINKELRDLDLKKNLQKKMELCERAEELILEPKVIKAFRELQKLHDMWREIGPVPREQKDIIWERFKKATSIINKKHQEYFENLKKEQENNLKAKQLLVEKANELAENNFDSHKDWEKNSKEILELQKIWKMIGFAPKKHNNRIYNEFRKACDLFFDKKRDFYAKNKEVQENNLQLKTDLCIQAESLMDSTDWKKTTDIYINLQKKWKTIGPVPRKNSEEIWNRFRKACNAFFDRKKEHFSEIDKLQEENLKQKEELITEIENFNLEDNNDEKNLISLKKFQKKWTEIGHVPIKQKDDIQNKYRKAIEEQFNKLNIDNNKREELKLKSKIENLKQQPKGIEKLQIEREKLRNKIEQLNSKLVLWENNLGFFAKSKNAEIMMADFKKKIESAKNQIAALHKQADMLTHSINNFKNN